MASPPDREPSATLSGSAVKPHQQRIDWLDGLRAIAVLFVLWAHLPRLEGGGWILLGARAVGAAHLGVDLFFILSGFLITSILLADSTKGSRMSVAAWFWTKRILRLFPIYYLTILVCLLIWPKLSYQACFLHYSNSHFSADATPHPLRHTWSLSVEQQFYLIWPWIVLVGKKHLDLLLYMVVLAGLAAPWIVLAFLGPELGDRVVARGLESRLLPLAMGSLLACHRHWRLPTPVWIGVAVLSYGALAATYWVVRMEGLDMSITPVKRLVFPLIALSMFEIARTGSEFVRRWISGRWLVGLGRISYGVYLFHLPIFFYAGISHMDTGAGPAHSSPWLVTLLALAATIVLAMISYSLIELPLFKFRNRLRPAWMQGVQG